MFPITFSSFGDIVTAVTLLVQIINALRGSDQNYRQLVQEINLFAEILDQFSRNSEMMYDELSREFTLKRVQLCYDVVDEVFERMADFIPLGQEPADTTIVARLRKGKLKIRWRHGMQEEAEQYVEKLHRMTGQLGVVMNLYVALCSTAHLTAAVYLISRPAGITGLVFFVWSL